MEIPNRGPELLAVNIAFLVTALLAFLLRCVVRLTMVKAFGRDDWLMGAATLFFTLYTISSNIGVHYGTGRHHEDLKIENVEIARHCWWFCYLFYTCSMICSKISIGFLLLRISIKKVHSWIIYAAMFISVVAGLTFFFVIIFQCNPVSYFWQRRLQSGTCVPNAVIVGLAYTYSVFSIISDFTFAILPGFLVWHLQLKRRTKVVLIPLITMGCVASAAVFARLPFIRHFNSPDFLWATLDIAIWSTIEQGLAITAGSLATLRPLFFLVVKRLGLSTARTGQRPSNYGPDGLHIPSNSGAGNLSKNDKFRPDLYKLSNIVETRTSNESIPQEDDIPKQPNWYNNNNKGYPPVPPPKESKKLQKKSQADNDSEKSLRFNGATEEEDGMRIMVSKSFYITDEERSMKERKDSYV